jgi:cholesterol oxidase
MVGCRHGAKNSLDRNYLYLAERGGARVLAERQAVDVVPLPGGGWEVVAERPGAWARRRRETFRAEQVVLAAGVLGTLRLLFAARRRGRLPRISPRLGDGVRTNSETLVGATARTRAVDYSRGIAIGSSIHPNAMGLLGTLLVDGGGRVPRPVRWLAEAARHPVTLARSLSVYRWSERTIILLVMQAKPGSLRVRERRRLAGFGFRLTSSQTAGEPSPTFIPEANEAARVTADAIGGVAGSALNEVLLNVPTTAHILGGACIGTSAENGVVDAYHRVFGHQGLHVVDGSCVGANLGVNPALTITALAERALSLWPNRGDEDPRPAPGAAYRRVFRVAPTRPAVPPGAPASIEKLARIGSFE